MSVTKTHVKCFSMLGLAIILAGCSGEPPLAETPPLEVIVSQPLPLGTKSELITDWDTYTGTVESQDSVEIRARAARAH